VCSSDLEGSPEAQKQFNREANILARLSHPNLPRVTDYFFIHGQGQYLVMDYIEGEDLKSMLKRLEHLPEPEVLSWIGQVADALAYLHSQNPPIIHRDIKPANIRIRTDGRAMLVDFGIAKIYDPSQVTTLGAKAVTPGYSPPEQYGGAVTDTRADIYALGATLYHLLTGKEPPESVQRIVNKASMPTPRELNSNISLAIEQLILKSTEIPTERRFQTIEELRKALTIPLEGSKESTPASEKEKGSEPVPSSRETIALNADELEAGISTSLTPEQTDINPPNVRQPEASQVKKKMPSLVWLVGGVVLVGCVFLMIAAIVGTKFLRNKAIPTTTVTITIKPTISVPILAGSPIAPSPTAHRTDTPPPITSPTVVSAVTPTSYIAVGSLMAPAGELVRGVAEKDGYVYLLTKKSILYVYNLTEMKRDQAMTTYDTPISSLVLQNGNGLFRNGNYLYVYGNAGFQVIDVSEPSRPSVRDQVKDLRIFNMNFSEKYLIAPGDGYIGIYDITNPSQPKKISLIRTGEGHSILAAALFQNMLYVSDFSNINNKPKGLLKVYNFSDPTNVQLLQTIDTETAYQLFIVNGMLVRCTPNDVELMDLSQKDYPRYLMDQRGEGYACVPDQGNVIANGIVTNIKDRGLGLLTIFDIKMGGEGLPAEAFAHDQSLPYTSYANPFYVFFAQNGRVLILASK
jgi:serine/threonine protein kinase